VQSLYFNAFFRSFIMIIKFTNFADGVHKLDFDEPVNSVGVGNPYKGNVNLTVEMDKSHSQIVLKCDSRVTAEFECDRCGEKYESEVRSHFQLTYLFDREPQKGEFINLYYLSPESDKIELKNDLKEFMLLSEPMKKLCKEDCKGLCYKCGTNLNYGTCNCKEDTNENVFSSLIKKQK
jgi:uncharacterized protein